MSGILDSALAAPIANLLIVAGLTFLAIAAIGKIAGKIEPDTAGRIASGLIGGAILALGLIIHFRPELLSPIHPSTPIVQAATETITVTSNAKLQSPTITLLSSSTPTVEIPTLASTDTPTAVVPTDTPTAVILPPAPPPEITSMAATPIPVAQSLVSPDQVIREYWNLVTARNYDLSWTYLSASFQAREHGDDQGNYAAGWDNINPCNIYMEVQGINQTASEAQILVHWILLSGAACTREEADQEYFLILSPDRTRWLIEAVKSR